MSFGATPVKRQATQEECEKVSAFTQKISKLMKEEYIDPSIALNSLFTAASHIIMVLADPNHDEKAVDIFRENLKTVRIIHSKNSNSESSH